MILDSDTPYAVASSLTRSRYSVVNYCYAVNLKGTKNDTEIEGFREAYLRDAAAFVRWVRFFVPQSGKDEPVPLTFTVIYS